MKTTGAVAASLVLATTLWSADVRAETLTITGEASTNSLSPTATLGSAELKVKGKGHGTVKLTCGILGELQGVNQDGSYNFRHTVVCDDHSVFILATHTVITPKAACPTRPGTIIGTFHEQSTLQGVDGPFAGTTGNLTIVGTTICGYNDMKIAGTATRP